MEVGFWESDTNRTVRHLSDPRLVVFHHFQKEKSKPARAIVQKELAEGRSALERICTETDFWDRLKKQQFFKDVSG